MIQNKKLKMIVGGDLVPTRSNNELFVNGDIRSLIGEELHTILKNAECRIFNLEVPLTDVEEPIRKVGPNLIAPTETINGIKALGVDILSLSNNHILDQGVQGLKSTCDVLEKNNIAYLGVGNTIEEASKPYIFMFGDKKIGLYACTEHEFSIVSDDVAGANPFDSLESFDQVAELKKKCDFVIVLYHGGKEHYRYPSPNLQKVCRKFIQKGANLVVCQHSHCIGCKEEFENAVIIYGQGNFIFDHSKNEHWQTSLLLEIDSELQVSFIPITKKEEVIRLAKDTEANQILEAFYKRSEEILVSGFIESEYKKFANSMLNFYLLRMLGNRNIVIRVLNKLSKNRVNNWLIGKKFDNQRKRGLQNIIECEAHRELLLYALKNK